MVSPDSYINWLLRKYQSKSKPVPYSNRRRTLNYDPDVDSTVLVGRSIKNPVTGYNYAYRIRANEDNAKELDAGLRKMFNQQAWKLLACVIYTGWTGGWRDVVNMLFWAGLYTETAAWRVRRKRPTRHKVTRDQYIREWYRVVQEGRDSTRKLPVWMEPYTSIDTYCKMYDHMNRSIAEGADIEWVAGALWQRWVVDGDGLRQGVSIPANAAAAHVITRFWLHNGWKSNNLILWFLAASGHWLSWEYIKAYWDERKARKEMEKQGQTPPASFGIDHKGHLYGAALGAWSGTVRPDNQWQVAAKNSIYIRAVSGKL